MMSSAETLVQEGLLPEDSSKRHYNFPLGFEGALPADMETLIFLKSRLPVGAGFGVIHEDFNSFRFLAGALAMGARCIRVGFEDGGVYAPKKTATTNLELVRKAAALVEDLGLELMNIEEARSYLGVLK
ncbi:MAG: 3-keto-5-aminohexanoate cleavage protein [Spirochaetales bacterium]|nr:3-keto-5-aminohexanoate cleavage protein [Spirochaetales bacterium]